jgi:hypothetical protein
MAALTLVIVLVVVVIVPALIAGLVSWLSPEPTDIVHWG